MTLENTSQPASANDDIDLLELGEHSDKRELNGPASSVEALLAMTRQARRSIKIFSQELNRLVYCDSDFVAQMSQIARTQRRCEIQILLNNPLPASKGNALVELYQRIPSAIEIREFPADYKDDANEFIVIDSIGLINWTEPNSLQGYAMFKSIPEARHKTEHFDYIWQRSVICKELRSFML